MAEEIKRKAEEPQVRPDVLNYDDIRKMVPFLDGKPRLVKWLMKFIGLHKVNWLHGICYDKPGVECPTAMLENLGLELDVEGEEILDRMPATGGFITVSNHPLGALDGISLISLVGKRRPDFKVMVNMILNYISGMTEFHRSGRPGKQRPCKTRRERARNCRSTISRPHRACHGIFPRRRSKQAALEPAG